MSENPLDPNASKEELDDNSESENSESVDSVFEDKSGLNANLTGKPGTEGGTGG